MRKSYCVNGLRSLREMWFNKTPAGRSNCFQGGVPGVENGGQYENILCNCYDHPHKTQQRIRASCYIQSKNSIRRLSLVIINLFCRHPGTRAGRNLFLRGNLLPG